MNVEKKFKSIVADIFKVKASKLKGKTRFVEDLNAKSIDLIALIAATENTFNITTRREETAKNRTISQSVAYIRKKLRSLK